MFEDPTYVIAFTFKKAPEYVKQYSVTKSAAKHLLKLFGKDFEHLNNVYFSHASGCAVISAKDVLTFNLHENGMENSRALFDEIFNSI